MKALKILAICLGGILALIFCGLFILGSIAPETSIYLGKQVPQKYIKQMKALNLLEDDETIVFFYSDAIIDLKEGFYFTSDKKLVLYSKEWEEPETIINFNDIIRLEAEYSDSWVEDSYITVETISGLEVSFPLSSEKGRDKKFVQYVRSKMPKVFGRQPTDSQIDPLPNHSPGTEPSS